MEKNKANSIVYVVACLTVLFLFVSRYILLGAGIVALLTIYIAIRERTLKIKRTAVFFLVFIFINLIQHLFTSNSEAIQEIERNLIYFILIILLYNIEIQYKVFIKIWRLMLAFCFAIQIVQFFKLFNINQILESVYGYNMFLKQATYSSIAYFRSGSIFMSLNPYVKFTAVSLAILFFDLSRDDAERIKDYVFIAIAFISSLLSGSRTGFVIIAIISMFFLISRLGPKANAKAIARIFLAGLGFVVVFIILNRRYNLLDARFFTTEATGSYDYKIEVIKKFLSEATGGQTIFGMGAYNASVTGYEMDSDLGYALSYYGFLGVAVFYSMIISLVGLKRRFDKPGIIYLLMLLIIQVLSGVTSGVYFNYRVFSIILLGLIPFHTSFLKTEADGGMI